MKTIRNWIVMMSLATVTVAGCRNIPSGGHDLDVWHAPKQSVDDRLEAASRLIARGSRMADAEKTLGQPSRMERRYGPSGGLGESRDYEYLFYEFGDGTFVCLRFGVSKTRLGDWLFSDMFAGKTAALKTFRIDPVPPAEQLDRER
jgi:hypothetical protein